MSQHHRRWFLKEVPSLLADGVIDADTARRLEARYTTAEPGRNRALTVFSILGGTLVGLGIILLLAHNWAELSRATRTALAFAPLICAQALAVWLIRSGRDSAAWREGVGLFWTFAIGAAIALVAQTYHIPGDAGRFAMTWMLLTLPVIYLLNASGPALVYLAGMLFWAADTQDNGGAAWVFWPLAALLLPHTYPAVRQNPYGSRAAVLLWGGTVALCIATAITLEDLVRDRWVFVYAVLFAALYLAGENWLADATSNWQRPLRTIGGGGCVVLTFQLTYDWMWDDFTWLFWTNHLQNNYAAILSNLILALMAVAVIALLVRSARHGKTHALFIGALPIMVGLGNFIAHKFGGGAICLANLYAFGLGLDLLIRGFRTRRNGTVNLGLLLLFTLILLRFWDERFGFVLRGVIFVVLCLAFLSVNLFLARHKKATP